MDQKDQKKLLIGVGIVLIVLITGYAVMKSKEMNDESAAPGEEDMVPAEEEDDNGAAPSGAAADDLSYSEAVSEYGESGWRFQFSDCSGTPGSLAMKAGTKFMLDNRDNKAHTFMVGKTAYHIGALGFAIATAKELGTYPITCDGGGAAEVTVQP